MTVPAVLDAAAVAVLDLTKLGTYTEAKKIQQNSA